MSEKYSKEAEAIKVLMETLEPLSQEIRASVIDYVIRRFDVSCVAQKSITSQESPRDKTQMSIGGLQDLSGPQMDIRQFKEQKSPKTTLEMIALVAYYLSNVASDSERKQTISAKDINAYFKMAHHKLPSDANIALNNAKNAGYIDLVRRGEYKLNAVGHNLIAHSLPISKHKAK